MYESENVLAKEKVVIEWKSCIWVCRVFCCHYCGVNYSARILLCSFRCVTSPAVNLCLPMLLYVWHWTIADLDTLVDRNYPNLWAGCRQLHSVVCGVFWCMPRSVVEGFVGCFYSKPLDQNSGLVFYCHWLEHILGLPWFVYNYIHVG